MYPKQYFEFNVFVATYTKYMQIVVMYVDLSTYYKTDYIPQVMV